MSVKTNISNLITLSVYSSWIIQKNDMHHTLGITV